MALGAATQWSVNSGATASNVNGGGFNTANANFITNYSATSATGNSPVISSASYTFVAGDVGAWIYVKSGTNWTAGFYQIASVAGGAATVNAAVGAAVQLNTSTNRWGPNTVAGCATVASPTSGTCGIDYSQGTAAIINGTDLASTIGTTNPSTITSSGTPFGVNHVGNIIHVTAGANWTAGWYEIVSVSGSTATLDRAVGTSATLSNGTFYVGGAISLGGANDDTVFENSIAGNTWWIKNGTYTLGQTVNIAAAGTLTSVINIIGFATIRGDYPTGSTRPLINGGSNLTAVGQYWNIFNCRFTSTAGAGSYTMILNPYSKAFNCQFRNSNSGTGIYMYSGTHIQNCHVSAFGTGQYGVQAQGYNTISGCYFDNCDTGVYMPTGFSTQVINSLFNNCKTVAIDFASTNLGGSIVHGCTFYGSESKIGIGIRMAATCQSLRITSNLFYGLTTAISHAASQTENYGNYNNFYNNTTDCTNFYKGPNDTAINPSFTSVSQLTGTTATTSSNQLVDSGASFSSVVDDQCFVHVKSGTGVSAGLYLITAHSATTLTTSPAISNNATADKVYSVGIGLDWSVGSALKGTGFPAAILGSNTTSYPDIGVAQRSEAAAVAAVPTGSGVPHLGPAKF